MKKTNKVFGMMTLIVGVMLVFAGCGGGAGGGTGSPPGKTPLATPTNVRVDHAGYTAFDLKWDEVDGADSYTVSIGGVLKHFDASTTSCDLSELASDPKVYSIKVRAVAWNGDADHSDSAYSAAINVEPAEYIFEYEDELAPSPSIYSGRSIARAAAGGKAITGLTNYGKGLDSIVVPRKIGSDDVIAIGNNAFSGQSQISSISLPPTIITIGAGAFSETSIASIVIPESVTYIGDGAFSQILVVIVVVFVNPDPPELGDDVFDGSDVDSIIVPDGSGDAYSDTIGDLADKVDEKPLTPLTITINAGTGGTITTTPIGSAYAGTTVRINVSPNQGYQLKSLSVTDANGRDVSTDFQYQSGGGSTGNPGSTGGASSTNGYSFKMPESNVTVSATFERSEYNITVSQIEGGTITTNPQGKAAAGTTVNVYVNPNQGYTLEELQIDDGERKIDHRTGQSSTGGVYYFFTMPAKAVFIDAAFTRSGTQPTQPKTLTITGISTTHAGRDAKVGIWSDLSNWESVAYGEGTINAGSSSGSLTVSLINPETEEPWNGGGQYWVSLTVYTANGTESNFFYINGQSSVIQLIKYPFTSGANATIGFNLLREFSIIQAPNALEGRWGYYGYDKTGTSYVDIEGVSVFINYADIITDYAITCGIMVTEVQQATQPDDYYNNPGTPYYYPSGYKVTGIVTSAGGTLGLNYLFNPNGPDLNIGDVVEIGFYFKSDDPNEFLFNSYSWERRGGGTQPGTEYNIAVDQTPNAGSVTVETSSSGSLKAAEGTTVTVYANPDQGYALSNLSIVRQDGAGIINYQTNQSSTGVYYTFTMPAADVMINATFTQSGTQPGGGTGG